MRNTCIDDIIDSSSQFVQWFGYQMVYTVMAPILECRYDLMMDLVKLGGDVDQAGMSLAEKDAFDKRRWWFYAKVTALSGAPIVLAVGAGFGVFYLNLYAARYVDILFKNFLDLGSPDLLQDLVWQNFAHFMVLYTVTYLSSQVVSSIIKSVGAQCGTEIYEEIHKEYNNVVFNSKNPYAIYLANDPEAKATAGSATNYIRGMVEGTAEATVGYVLYLSQTAIALTNLYNLDPMFLGAILGFSIASNLIYGGLTHIRTILKDRLKVIGNQEVNISYEGIRSAVTMMLNGQMEEFKGLLDEVSAKGVALNRMCTLLDQICAAWQAIYGALRFALTYYLIGTGLYSGSIGFSEKAGVVTAGETLEAITNRGAVDKMINTNRANQIATERILKVLKGKIKCKVITITPDENTTEIQVKNLNVTVHTRQEILSEVNISFKVGDVHFINGDNGEGKSTFLKAIRGISDPIMDVTGEVIMPEGRVLYVPAEPFMFANHNHPIDTILGNITAGVRDHIEKNHCKNLRELIIQDDSGSLSKALFEMIEKKKEKLQTTIEHRKKESKPIEEHKKRLAKFENYNNEWEKISGTLQWDEGAELDHKIKTLASALLYLANFGEIAERIDKDEEARCSTGQSKAISLVRAILSNPKVLMIDETFSNLSLTNKTQMARVLRTCLPEATMLIVNHEDDVKKCFELVTKELGKGEIHEYTVSYKDVEKAGIQR